MAIFGEALDADQILRLMSEGPRPIFDEADTGETIDGTDTYRNVEHLLFADGARAYVLGSGSENVAELSAEDVGRLAEGGRLVVLGDASQALRLIGSWLVEEEIVVIFFHKGMAQVKIAMIITQIVKMGRG